MFSATVANVAMSEALNADSSSSAVLARWQRKALAAAAANLSTASSPNRSALQKTPAKSLTVS